MTDTCRCAQQITVVLTPLDARYHRYREKARKLIGTGMAKDFVRVSDSGDGSDQYYHLSLLTMSESPQRDEERESCSESALTGDV
jgi:hypothetical protein